MWHLLWASTMRKHMKRKQSDAVSFSVSCSSWSISWARPCKVRACGTLMDALSTSIPPSWLDLNGIILLSLIWCSFVTDWNFVWAPLVLLVMCSYQIYEIQESWLQSKFILVKFEFERESQKNLDLHGFGFKSGTPLPWPLPWKSKCWIFAIPSANWDHLWQISRDKSRWQIWILPTWGLPGREELEHIARWLPRIYCRHSI